MLITFVLGIIQSTVAQSQKSVKAYFFGGWLVAGWRLTEGRLAV